MEYHIASAAQSGIEDDVGDPIIAERDLDRDESEAMDGSIVSGESVGADAGSTGVVFVSDEFFVG